MRVEPEHVLEQQRVAADPRVEHADMEDPFERQQDQRDRQHRRGEQEDHAGRVERPDEHRQPVPRQSGRAQPVDGDDEVQPGRDGGEAGDEDPGDHRHDVPLRIVARQRRVERPARVHAAGEQRVERAGATRHEQVPAHQVDLREREVARADHQRDDEVADRHRCGRHQEEPHHDHAVHGEQPVVRLGRGQGALRRDQVVADQGGRGAADEEEDRDRQRVQDRDALVVRGEQPAPQRLAVLEIAEDACGGDRLAHRGRSGARDWMKATRRIRSSSGMTPSKDGMTGAKPATTWRFGCRIESRM